MKLLRRCVLPVLAAVILLLYACTSSPAGQFEDLLNKNEKNAVSALYKDYRELYDLYKKCNTEYIKNTEAAINTIIGQKYGYSKTAYEHSDKFAGIAEMFFDDAAENTLNIYFSVYGYEEKEYSEEGNNAEYKCKKNNDAYLYKASYDAENRSFELVLEVNGELKERFKCSLENDSLYKYYYKGSLDRTFISSVNKDGTSRIDWYDGYTEDGSDVSAENHGYTIYDGRIITGIIR